MRKKLWRHTELNRFFFLINTLIQDQRNAHGIINFRYFYSNKNMLKSDNVY